MHVCTSRRVTFYVYLHILIMSYNQLCNCIYLVITKSLWAFGILWHYVILFIFSLSISNVRNVVRYQPNDTLCPLGWHYFMLYILYQKFFQFLTQWYFVTLGSKLFSTQEVFQKHWHRLTQWCFVPLGLTLFSFTKHAHNNFQWIAPIFCTNKLSTHQ